MKRIVTLIGAIVLSASVAASAQVVTADQLRQWFLSNNNDRYNQGFRAGFAAGVADAARTAYGYPGMITQGVMTCTQNSTLPNLVNLASGALQQWLSVRNQRLPAAWQVLNVYNTCTMPGMVPKEQGTK
jgi:opacity protein-like surface antigen